MGAGRGAVAGARFWAVWHNTALLKLSESLAVRRGRAPGQTQERLQVTAEDSGAGGCSVEDRTRQAAANGKGKGSGRRLNERRKSEGNARLKNATM